MEGQKSGVAQQKTIEFYGVKLLKVSNSECAKRLAVVQSGILH